MKRKSLGLWIAAIVGVLAMIILPVPAASAEEPEPARTEEPEPARTEEPSDTADRTSTTTEWPGSPEAEKGEPALGSGTRSNTTPPQGSPKEKRPRSLADLAGGIDLNSSQEEGSESIVITNQNLKTMGKGAVVTEGSNLGGSSPSSELWQPTPRGGKPPTGEDIEAARREVERLESQASAIDQAVEENKAVNLFNGGGPQYRAPGQTDPLQNQQSGVTQDLSDARARLSDMEKAAARASRPGAASGPPAANSSGSGDGE